jgi:hypothetical protein
MVEKQLRKRDVVAGVLSAAVAVVSAFGVYGEQARVVDIVTIFAGGMGAGASLVPIIQAWRRRVRGAGS